jgi:homopolymeric O-antigen transport system permease protein
MTMQVDLPGGPQSETAPGPIEAAGLPVTDIGPARGWQLVDVGELWRFRDLLWLLTWRDVAVRYKQTLLGAAWAVLQPALLMVVFTVVFGRMTRAPAGDVGYPVFVYAGLLPWTFFATAVTSAGTSVFRSERLITKVYFPRLAIPLASASAALVDFVIAFALLLILMACSGVRPGVGLLLIPPVLGAVALAAVGAGTLLGALSVFYRDFRHAVPFLIQFWMFATPSIYAPAGPDEGWGWHLLLRLNPLSELIGAFRAACLGGPIDWGPLGLAVAAAALLFVVGCLYFRKVEDHFADVL